LIAGRYISEVLKEEFFRTAAGVLEKRVFWDNRIVSDSLAGLSGLADKEEEKELQQAEEKADGGSALERGWKERMRVGRAPSYRLMVCSRIGLVDRRLNWVSVQSPANTSSTDSPMRARG